MYVCVYVCFPHHGRNRNLKPLFALCFDALPLFSYHCKSYLLFWGTLGSTAYGLIAAIPSSLSNAVFTFLLWAGMNSVVWNDIAIDGMTVQKMKLHKHVDTELQSFQVFPGIVVSIFTSFSSGFIIDAIGLQWLYAIVCLIAVTATVACMMMDEKRDHAHLCNSSEFFPEYSIKVRLFSFCCPP